MGYSIVVCCFNSAERLPPTLEHLAALRPPDGEGLELLLIDNASQDDTVAVARRTWAAAGAPFPLRVCREETPGLSAARERGIAEARYAYILFCDDDNWLSPDYLQVAQAVLRGRPRLGMLGGLGTPVYEAVPPEWPDHFNVYGSGPQERGDAKARVLHGAGLILHKAAYLMLQEAGFRFLLTDRKGQQLSSGGDHELCYAVRMAGFDVDYEPRLCFRHFIGRHRVTPRYVERFVRESVPAEHVLFCYAFVLRRRRHSLARLYASLGYDALHHLKQMARYAEQRLRYRANPRTRFYMHFRYQYHRHRLAHILAHPAAPARYYRSITALQERLQAAGGKNL